jgi:myo-inositol-1(or 4)-monophosphatase
MTSPIEQRREAAIRIAHEAGELGLKHFREIETLTIEKKGHQDLVSNADRELEVLVRERLAEAFPEDGITGEEHADRPGMSGFTWAIDPIDGTANFVRGIPAWCVSIACADAQGVVVGVIREPSSGETFAASRGGGASVNGRPMKIADISSLGEGTVGVGFSNRSEAKKTLKLIGDIIGEGGFFFRNASGALMLAYVAAGRLIGYVEEHMNSWDCLAAFLMIEEAGGTILRPDPDTMIKSGCMAICGGPKLYPRLEQLAQDAFGHIAR